MNSNINEDLNVLIQLGFKPITTINENITDNENFEIIKNEFKKTLNIEHIIADYHTKLLNMLVCLDEKMKNKKLF